MSAVRFLDSHALRATGGMPRLSYATATANAAQPYNWKRDTNEILNATEVAKEQAGKMRIVSEQVQQMTENVKSEANAETQTQLQTTIEKRMDLKVQLEDALRRAEEEIAALEFQRKVVYGDQNALQEPLYVSSECLKSREYRPPREKTRDHVERALVDQSAAVQNAINTLSSAHHACTAELERLLALKDLIERDIADKSHALALDQQCLGLVAGQYPLAPVEFNAAGIDSALVGSAGAVQTKSGGLPYVWKSSTNNLMNELFKASSTAQRVRAESEAVRSDSAAVEADTRTKVKQVLNKKLEETAQLRAQLEAKLEDVVQEIKELEKRQGSLEASLAEMLEPLAVAQQKLMVRKQRPAREQVRDSAELALEKEVATFRNTIAQLSNEQNKAKAEKSKLLEAQHQIELDIKDKMEAQRIDLQCVDLQSRVQELMDDKLRLFH